MGQNADKTHCPRGHEYTEENTLYQTGKYGLQRSCRVCRRLRQKNRTDIRKHALWRNYHMTVAEYDLLFESQHGVCAACGQAEYQRSVNGTIQPLSVDHNHVTKVTRGLLCKDCNTALGHLQDNSERIHMLFMYAKAHGL
jgi:Recombination endonuclease VII